MTKHFSMLNNSFVAGSSSNGTTTISGFSTFFTHNSDSSSDNSSISSITSSSSNSSSSSNGSSHSSSSGSTCVVRFSTVTHRCVGSFARNHRHRKMASSLRRMGDELYLRRLPFRILAAILISKFLPRSIRRTLMQWWKKY